MLVLKRFSPRTRLGALVLLALAAAYRTLSHSPDPHLIARWWVTAAIATVVLLIASRKQRPYALAALTLGLVAIAHLAGHSRLFAVSFALVNVVEAGIVAWWMTRGFRRTPRMHSWADYFTWLRAVAAACAVAATASAVIMAVDQGAAPWRTFVWVFVTHLGAQCVIVPLALDWPDQERPVPRVEHVAHLGLLAVVAVMFWVAGPAEPVAFVLLPLLLWSAGRFTSHWTNLELLASAGFVAVLTAFDHGPFYSVTGELSLLEIAASSQTFLAVCGVAVMGFAVAVHHLFASLRQNAQHEMELHQLLDSARGTAFIVTDPDGTITLFSPGAELLLGYRADEVVDRSTPLRFHDRREILRRARELGIAPDYRAVTKGLEDGADQESSEWTYICKDGARLTVSLNATAVRDTRGRPLRYLNIVRDITDRRAAEQALVFALNKERETTQRMQEIDRVKDEFISTVSHELRTPLTSIMGYTEILSDGMTGELTSGQSDLVERIDRNSERLLRLVEDLLTLARFEQLAVAGPTGPVDLREIVQRAVAQTRFAAERRRVTVQVRLPSEPATLVGDAADLERMASNLVDNAIKFSHPDGTVRVTLQVHGRVARLTIADDGVGVPLEEQGHIFDRFYRSSISSHLEIQGTGLGLSIVRAVASAHDGHVSLTSEPDVGSTFTVGLPLQGRTPTTSRSASESPAPAVIEAPASRL